MGRFMDAIKAAVTEFQRRYNALAPSAIEDTYCTTRARRGRYALCRALWDNTAYDSGISATHTWSTQFKTSYGLYKYTQGVFNPAQRLIEFDATHLLGGAIDPKAGDGVQAPSSLPIVGEAVTDDLRHAIAHLWRSSRWGSQAIIWYRYGAMLGDAGLKIQIDPGARAVRLVPLDPSTILDVTQDDVGNLSSYVIEEMRPDPQQSASDRIRSPKYVTYQEWCYRTGTGITFKTYKDGALYDWRGSGSGGAMPAEWQMPIPFVPLVLAQHIDVGKDWGVSELLPAVAKVVATDDAGSKVLDQIRRTTEAKWLLSGIRGADIKQTGITTPSYDNPQPGRQDDQWISAADPGARATPLVAPMDYMGIDKFIGRLFETLESDYPELRYEKLRMASQTSGETLREARKPVETKIKQRRAGYDPVLAEAHRRAIALGGMLGLPGYEGFGVADWDGRATEHQIGDRPVFEVGEADRLADEEVAARAVKGWVDAGLPLETALARAGWSDEAIAEALEARARADAMAIQQQRTIFAAAPEAEPDQTRGGGDG